MKMSYTCSLLLASSLLAAPLAPALAQSADAKVLRIVVPFAPGGAQDVIARYLSTRLSARMGQNVIVENKAGAGGAIAADFVARSAPDGNTVFQATGGAISIAPHLNSKLPYDPLKDFVAIGMVADTPMTIAVRAASPYQSVADVLRDAKARPGQVSYASTGPGTVSHLTGELFAQTAGVQLLHVPYKGAAPALVDLLGGQVAMMVTSAASMDAMVESDRARVLATFTTTRLSNMKGAPTMVEATGFKGLEVPVWVGMLAPAKTPPAVVARLSAELMAVCRLPETQERFKGLGAMVACAGSQELTKVIAEDFQRWGTVIRTANIKSE